MATDGDLPTRTFGWWDMFVHEDDDPRQDGGWDNEERSVLLGFLNDRRVTLRLKCQGLDAEQMARHSVPPSDLSLLGLVRHIASVENYWFQHVIADADSERLFCDETGADQAFEVEPDDAIVDEAWSVWSREVERSDAVIGGVADMGAYAAGQRVPVREVLVHVIREYAQHLGHADLLRERIDGRVGQ